MEKISAAIAALQPCILAVSDHPKQQDFSTGGGTRASSDSENPVGPSRWRLGVRENYGFFFFGFFVSRFGASLFPIA